MFRLVARAAVGALTMLAVANAQTSDGAPEQVVITGQKLEETLPQQLANYGTHVDTVTAEQIANGSYIDVAQTLQSLAPGLYVASKNGPFDYVDISLQGSRTADVLWLVDGVRINNRLYAGTTPLDTLPAGMVERIEVLDGSQALFYGTQAVAGAVNVVTKGFSAQPDGALSLGGDTNDSRHLDGYFRDAIGGHQFVLYGSSDHSTGYQPFRDQDYQPSTTDRRRAYDVLTLGGKYAYDFGSALRLSADVQHTDGKLDYATPELVAEAYNERDENLVSAKLDYTPNDTLQLFAKAYGHWWYAHYTEFDHELDATGAVMPGMLDIIDDHDFWGYKDYGANFVAKLAPRHGLEYLLGYDYQQYSGNDAVLVITKKSEEVNALFGQVRLTQELLPLTHLALGLRYNNPSVGQSATVWNASAQVDVSTALFLRASAGTSFRLPTAEELFANDPNDERGDSNLKPERSQNFSGSVGGNIPAATGTLDWEVIGFYRSIQDLITFDGFDATTNQSLAENSPGKVTVRGAELVLNAAFTPAFSANASFTANHARMDGSNDQITRIPEQQYKLGFDYHPANLPLGAGLTLDHVGSVYSSQWDGLERYGDYTVMDVNGRLYLDPRRRQTLTLRVENLFNKAYATRLGNAVRDSDGSDYTYWDLGLPRTYSLRYTYHF
jgi:vitamin B12 transporter